MNTTPEGKFCETCSHCVIDFTNWTDGMIAEYILKHSGEKICGRLHVSQLNRNISLPAQRSTRLCKLAVAAGLVLIFSQAPQVYAYPKAPFTIECLQSNQQDTTKITGDTTFNHGVAIDHVSKPSPTGDTYTGGLESMTIQPLKVPLINTDKFYNDPKHLKGRTRSKK